MSKKADPATAQEEFLGWLTGIINKRTPDVLRALMELIEVARRRGRCTADDIETRNFQQPNVIGAAHKLLPSLGLTYDTISEQGETYIKCIKSKRPEAHGRLLPVWVVQHPQKLTLALRAIKHALFVTEPADPQGQLL